MKFWQLIILDRDGVINHDSDDYIKSVDEWHAIPGSLDAIAHINQMNIPVVICSNQSGVGRGLFSVDALHEMHLKLKQLLSAVNGHIDNIYVCLHHPDDHCECRKPQPGMMIAATHDYDADPAHTLVIGDSLRDIEAAHAAGCKAVLVKTGKGKRTAELTTLPAIAVYDDLATAIEQELNRHI
jgi:D-glycero-D-manno-heptose 1,7-bisphosphate phosphatase